MAGTKSKNEPTSNASLVKSGKPHFYPPGNRAARQPSKGPQKTKGAPDSSATKFVSSKVDKKQDR